MSILKKILYIFILLVVVVGGWIIIYYDHLQRFPSILPAFYSKEICSCLYVLKRSEANCHIYARASLFAISEFKHDTKIKKITVIGLGRTASASFVSERYGCILD